MSSFTLKNRRISQSSKAIFYFILVSSMVRGRERYLPSRQGMLRQNDLQRPFWGR